MDDLRWLDPISMMNAPTLVGCMVATHAFRPLENTANQHSAEGRTGFGDVGDGVRLVSLKLERWLAAHGVKVHCALGTLGAILCGESASSSLTVRTRDILMATV